MQRNDAPWREHLDIITAWGEASAANDTPSPTDEQLWTASRVRQDLNLPEHIDAGLLSQLREAFNKGRWPGRIDLSALADALRERGHDAHVEHSGGSVVATLYAGRQAPDRDGDPRWSAAVGPGRYEARDPDRPVADAADCYIGPDGVDAWAVKVPDTWTIDTLVELTIAVIDEVKARQARFARAADDARDAMWATFAAAYPEVTAGDVAPGADRAFVAESNKLLAGWLDDNDPASNQPPAHLAEMARRAATDNPPAGAGPADAAGPEAAR